MVEFLFDKSTEYFFPSLASEFITAMDEMHGEQNPPYSMGLFFIPIRERFKSLQWVNKIMFGELAEPIFTIMVRENYVYTNKVMSKFATRRINDDYKTYRENMIERFPGYVLAKDGKLRVNESSLVVNL